MEWLICLQCGWSGEPDELVSKTEDLNDDTFVYCPLCGECDFDVEEIEEEENEC